MDSVLNSPELKSAVATYRRDVLKRLINTKFGVLRAKKASASADAIAGLVAKEIAKLSTPPLLPVVNATGISLHTNLGRALLTKSAQDAVRLAASSYCPLEMDLETGKRTRRDLTLEPLITAVTGTEAATVVNNTAAAVYLILHTFARDKTVITSRGELVEIGGSYRVPDVVAATGCKLKEVGTTNRTRLSDYEKAITKDTALLLKTHTSNFRVKGFTEEAALEELCALGKKKKLPVVWDLGSGYLPSDNPDEVQIPEPNIFSAVKAGADLICFSGDKLLGGPQAGIIVGKKKYIEALRKSPLWRALRIEKFTVAALAATFVEHMKARAPLLIHKNFLAPTLEKQDALAESLLERLTAARPDLKFIRGQNPVFYGGGSVPEHEFLCEAIAVVHSKMNAEKIDHAFRNGLPAIVGTHRAGKYWLNLLTLLPGDDVKIITAVKALGA